jgi:hypothetical protein
VCDIDQVGVDPKLIAGYQTILQALALVIIRGFIPQTALHILFPHQILLFLHFVKPLEDRQIRLREKRDTPLVSVKLFVFAAFTVFKVAIEIV